MDEQTSTKLLILNPFYGRKEVFYLLGKQIAGLKRMLRIQRVSIPMEAPWEKTWRGIVEKYRNDDDKWEIIFAPLTNKQIALIHLKEILFLQEEKGVVFIVTRQQKYTCLFKFFDIFETLQAKSEDFKLANHSIMVNVSKILAYDSSRNKIFFASDLSINSVGPFIKYLKTRDTIHRNWHKDS